jgi:hypothetical protein
MNYSTSPFRKITSFFFVLLFVAVIYNVQAQSNVKLEKVWATDTIFKTPECVAIDYENQILFVSNVNKDPWILDGNGYISIINFKGEVVNLEWVKGMHAPKGMGVYDGFLYVADIDAVIKIDIKKGKVAKRIKSDPTYGLNDISISKNGKIYISGSNSNKIFTIEKNKLKVFEEDDYDRPNGLLAEEDRLLALTSGSSILYEIDYEKHEKIQLAAELGHGDGIAPVGDGSYILSDWQGRIFYMDAENNVTTLLDTREKNMNTADIAFSKELNLLFVPTFFDNRVLAFKLVK